MTGYTSALGKDSRSFFRAGCIRGESEFLHAARTDVEGAITLFGYDAAGRQVKVIRNANRWSGSKKGKINVSFCVASVSGSEPYDPLDNGESAYACP